MDTMTYLGEFAFWAWICGSLLLAAGGFAWLLADQPRLRNWHELKSHVRGKIAQKLRDRQA